ncbi:hypothetical protein BDD12DRAFT_47328 [Trichophaea hybrida]|nr:hypothetical protein BDD12DRAFT_47328 [Trichophaea hybrida]
MLSQSLSDPSHKKHISNKKPTHRTHAVYTCHDPCARVMSYVLHYYVFQRFFCPSPSHSSSASALSPSPTSRIGFFSGIQVMRWVVGHLVGWPPPRYPFPTITRRWGNDGVFFFSLVHGGGVGGGFSGTAAVFSLSHDWGSFFFSGRRCFGETRALLMAFDLRETNPPLPHSALWARHRELDLDSILLDWCKGWWWGFPLCDASCAKS